MIPDSVLNAEDVARILHLGKNTVYQLAKEGQLGSYRVGRKLRFTMEDIEAYIASGQRHATSHEQVIPVFQSDDFVQVGTFGQLTGDAFTIAGGDVAADILTGMLHAQGQPINRLVCSSYTALVNLYAAQADAAVVHLYDQKSNSYNTAYARNLAPGASIVVIRLYGRDQGFIVQAGNPKRLTSWGALLRGGVRLVNREKGSGSRILLDEKLQAMDARGEVIEGYTTQVAGAQAAVGRIASGVADVTIGTAREAAQSSDVDFVPLQTEWIDVVIAKNDSTRPLVRQLKSIAASDDLRRNLQALGPCDISKLGSITFEA